MAQPSEGTPPDAAPTLPSSDVAAARRQRIDEFKLRAAQPSRGQQHIVVSAALAERVAAWRKRLGGMVRVSDDGVTFSAAIGVLLDIVELMGADYARVITRDELLEIAKAYPYRGRKALDRPPVLPRETSRDPRSPMPLVRDAQGAVFSGGHRWKLQRHKDNPDVPKAYQDVCTKCGEQRYILDYPNSKPCPFALEPNDYQSQKAADQRSFLVMQTPDSTDSDLPPASNSATPEAP